MIMRDYFYCCVKWLIIVCLPSRFATSLISQTLLPPNTLVLQLEHPSSVKIKDTLPNDKIYLINLNDQNFKLMRIFKIFFKLNYPQIPFPFTNYVVQQLQQ